MLAPALGALGRSVFDVIDVAVHRREAKVPVVRSLVFGANLEHVIDRSSRRRRRYVFNRRRSTDANKGLGCDVVTALTDQPGDDLSALWHFCDMSQRAGGETDHRRVEQHGGEHLTAAQHTKGRVVVRRQHTALAAIDALPAAGD